MSALLELDGVSVRFPAPGAGAAYPSAVDSVSLRIDAGEMPGLVGESGSGKTTLGRAILRLVPLASGAVRWQGRRIDSLRRRDFRPLRRELQLVFQDPVACLDPRMTVAESVAEPLRSLAPELSPESRSARVARILEDVGLALDFAARYPHQLSGGQLQRAVIARALVVAPRFVVFDEPVSALDVSVQGQIINLLAGIRRDRGLAGLFISHNLAVVARLCERILVMYRGRIVESAPRQEILRAPLHPYTRALLDSVPAIDAATRERLRRRPVARLLDEAVGRGFTQGCAYAARCPFVLPRCRLEAPPLAAADGERRVACHRAGEWPAGVPLPDRA